MEQTQSTQGLTYKQVKIEMNDHCNIYKLQEVMLYKERWNVLLQQSPDYGDMAKLIQQRPVIIQAWEEWHRHQGSIESVIERTLLCMDIVLGSELVGRMLQQFGDSAICACMGFIDTRFPEHGTARPQRTLLANALSWLALHEYPINPSAGLPMIYGQLGLSFKTIDYVDKAARSFIHTAPKVSLH